MLVTAKLETFMWGAAIKTANYLRNRSPCKSINYKTPYEKMFKKPPSLNHLKIFGSKAYPLILNKKRSKFEPTAQDNCIMAGYDESDGIYWIYNKSNRSMFRCRDVKFNEQSMNNPVFEMTTELSKFNIDDNASEHTIEDNSNNNILETNLDELILTDMIENAETESNDNDESSIQQNDENTIEDQLIRRSNRITKAPNRITIDPKSKAYLTNQTNDDLCDPKDINEALNGPNCSKWKQAIQSELESIKANNVWNIVDRPANKKVIGTRWVFKIKRNENNVPERFKARLVAKGYDQKYGIDYSETFAPVVRVQSLRTIFAVAANCDLEIHQIDIDTAFLNGELEEEVFIEPTPGCNICRKKQVCHLNKSLYGLKQAPRT